VPIMVPIPSTETPVSLISVLNRVLNSYISTVQMMKCLSTHCLSRHTQGHGPIPNPRSRLCPIPDRASAPALTYELPVRPPCMLLVHLNVLRIAPASPYRSSDVGVRASVGLFPRGLDVHIRYDAALDGGHACVGSHAALDIRGRARGLANLEPPPGLW